MSRNSRLVQLKVDIQRNTLYQKIASCRGVAVANWQHAPPRGSLLLLSWIVIIARSNIIITRETY